MTLESLLTGLVIAPGALFAALAFVWLLGWTPGERVIAKLTATLYTLLTAGAIWLGYSMGSASAVVETREAHWFHIGKYHFGLALRSDWLSFPLITITILLAGLVGVFSVRYLHRDRGYFRFFLLLHLFTFGALLVVTAANLDLLLCGWELVGVTSVLLIAFFSERREPVRNAVRVFGFYRVADLGLLIALFVLHAEIGGTHPTKLAELSTSGATLVGLLLLMAAAGKSAQAPFSAWLPRAMEGPTPSSAIFYGAISVHLGAYLLLRTAPVLEKSPLASVAVATVGALTALLATLVHRACTDAKTSLAFAGMAQLGLIFIEISLGWYQLALTHMLGHAVVRTLQFLRAPSMLHDYHRVHAAAGGHLDPTGEHYQRILPEPVRLWLYRAAVDRGYQDALLDRLVIGPAQWLAKVCEALEPGARAHLAQENQTPARKPVTFARRVEG